MKSPSFSPMVVNFDTYNLPIHAHGKARAKVTYIAFTDEAYLPSKQEDRVIFFEGFDGLLPMIHDLSEIEKEGWR